MRTPPRLVPRLTDTFFALCILAGACGSSSPGGTPIADGTGGSKGSGGSGGSRTGGTSGGSGGSQTGGTSGGSGGTSGGSGGSPAASGGSTGDAAVETAAETGGSDTSSPADVGGGTSDAPTSRPDAPGAACATGGNYNFTIRPFPAKTGTFTAYFTVTPSRAPTNSVIGLSDGMKYLHDDFSAIVRFGESGNIDVRNGTAYTALTPIKYKVIDYHFRLVLNVTAKTYDAYVTFENMPEVTLGTNLAFRDSAPANKLDYWGVEAVAGSVTKVCGFLAQ